MSKLLSAYRRRGYLMSDGAMGTSLFELGLQTGDAPELWNVVHGDIIRSVYREYLDAGSDIILTNSFGGNSYRLRLHGLGSRVLELNEQAALLGVREIRDFGGDILLAGSIGPTGEILEPVGSLSLSEAADVFCEQARGLLLGGVDILWVETMSSLEEVSAAIRGCRMACELSGIEADIVATLTFDTNGRTMMGVDPISVVDFFRNFEVRVSAFGLNCGLGPSETVASLLRMREVADDDMILVCQSNCGVPEYRDGGFCFSGTPELMGRYAVLAYACGARIIGGCCGSDGVVMREVRRVLDNLGDDKGVVPDIDLIVRELGEITDSSYGLHVHGGGSISARKRRRS